MIRKLVLVLLFLVLFSLSIQPALAVPGPAAPKGEPKHPFCFSGGTYLGICGPFSFWKCTIVSGKVWRGILLCQHDNLGSISCYNSWSTFPYCFKQP